MTRARSIAIGLVFSMGIGLVPVTDARAAEPKYTRKGLEELEKKAAKLSKDYRGDLVTLDDARKAAKKAGEHATSSDKKLTKARSAIARLASDAYANPAADVALVSGGNPEEVLRNAGISAQIATTKDRQIEAIRALALKSAAAKKAADTKVGELDKELKALEKRRDKVKALLKKYKEEVAERQPAAPERRGTGKSPLVGNYMTDRMRKIYLEIDNKFGKFPSIGCHRPGDPQDHGSGRACDFMESTGGRMPSASAQEHGDAVAKYAVDNASRLGVKYVIWKQRIYDVRSSGGWKQMSDRGSITQNHYDHVHISAL